MIKKALFFILALTVATSATVATFSAPNKVKADSSFTNYYQSPTVNLIVETDFGILNTSFSFNADTIEPIQFSVGDIVGSYTVQDVLENQPVINISFEYIPLIRYIDITFENFYSDSFNNTARIPYYITFDSSSDLDSANVITKYAPYDLVENDFDWVLEQRNNIDLNQATIFSSYAFSEAYFIDNTIFFNQLSVEIANVGSINSSAFNMTISFFQPTFAVYRNYLTKSRQFEEIEYVVNVQESLFASVESFFNFQIFPDFTIYHLLAICLVLPILIAILKVWLGG